MNFPPKYKNFSVELKKLIDAGFSKTRSYAFLRSLSDQTKVCLACSGGSDSVFLVLLFCAYFPKLAESASLLHLNHNLRGQESDEDENYVREFAKNLGLNFFSGKLKRSDEFLSEGTLHDIRQKFFDTQMRMTGAKILALGHQKNDIFETVIMRLSRASGLDGLSAPHEIQKFTNGNIKIRPLLFIKKEEIESILRKFEIPWRVDSSNLCCDYFRNQVRNRVFKEIQEGAKQYDIIENFAKSQAQIAEANDTIEYLAAQYLPKSKISDKLDIENFRTFPKAILRRILNKWLSHNNILIKRSEFEELMLSLQSRNEKILNCVADKRLVLRNGTLRVVHSNEKRSAFSIEWVHGEICFPNGKVLRKRILKPTQEAVAKTDAQSEAYIKFSNVLKVSSFCPGVRYIQFGHKTSKKIKELIKNDVEQFQDKPMVCIGEDICWVPGLSVSNPCKIKANAERALLLTYS